MEEKDNLRTEADAPQRAQIGLTPEFADPDELYRKLEDSIRKYRPNTDLSNVRKAYELAKQAHGEQKRKSGEPYINHPLSVAIILAELEMDKETIIAGLLHDVVEDTPITEEELTEMFGSEVTLLVDGVTKLTKLNYSQDKVEIQAENLRKMFLAMAKDIRVVVIKLADRLHNMRTMQYQTPNKQLEKSRETLDIYSPLAQRLGISKIKTELDDLALKFLEPEVYRKLSEEIKATRYEREAFIRRIIAEVEVQLKEAGIEAKLDGRAKHFFSIYRKMVNQNKTLDQIYDLFAVRIIVASVKDCYAALGVIHEMYKPIPGRFKDYIAMPKPNMYQSLHTTLIGPEGTPFEIQIRTEEMHRTAEYGIAAHWKYKEAQNGIHTSANEEQKLAWLREILDWQREMSDNKEFLNSLKNDLDLFNDSVYCFTPTGDVKTLPVGSNPVDFAYSIHSAVGNKMIGARVNGKLVTIDYEIQNGDQIEIITSANSKGPSRDWLKIVKSTQAKSKISQWFKAELKEDNILRGKNLLNAYAKAKGVNISDLLKPEYQEVCMRKYGFRDWDSLLAAVGHGSLKEGQVINRLNEEWSKAQKRNMTAEKAIEEVLSSSKAASTKPKGGILVKGVDDLAVHFSRCCAPVPGDEIVGFVTRGRGISIHRTDCVNILHLPRADQQRLIEAEWSMDEEEKTDRLYNAEIKIFARNNPGVLLEVTRVLSEDKVNISSIIARPGKNDISTIVVAFEIRGTGQLNSIINRLRQIDQVLDIERTTG
ncbi:MAG: bifunctional (p)ppGpp synthetase/guanosine-3',5'-bis(diphosphate) 3'-pyrophosphohydrolase [Lachnospiraceae bacterium]|nr:bifunctional (p)ppGpp synthetase/guanosine-3',5'-bis(diphosphate) 3'-pyrophosphohydrolase [Lachnospiraceae bacterium]